jgi:branched-chain amino acid transport system permease protein
MQALLNGAVSGLQIAALAVAFALVYRPTGILYFALGGIYAIAPYIANALHEARCSWFIAIGLAVAGGAAISFLCELLNHGPLDRRNATYAPHLVSSLGIYIILEQAIVLWKGPDVLSLVPGSHGSFPVCGAVISVGQVVLGSVAMALLGAFFAWTRLTNVGLQMRGLAESPSQMALFGHNVRTLRLGSFAVAGLMAAALGIAQAYDQSVDPYSGLPALLLSLVAVISGGRRSFLAPVLMGIVLGVLREETIWFLSDKWQETITYSLLVCALMLAGNANFKRWSAGR